MNGERAVDEHERGGENKACVTLFHLLRKGPAILIAEGRPAIIQVRDRERRTTGKVAEDVYVGGEREKMEKKKNERKGFYNRL